MKYIKFFILILTFSLFNCSKEKQLKISKLEEKKPTKLFFLFYTNNFNSKIKDVKEIEYENFSKEGWYFLDKEKAYIYYKPEAKIEQPVTISEIEEKITQISNIININFDNGKFTLDCYKADSTEVIKKIMQLKGYDVYIQGKFLPFTYKATNIEFNLLLDILKRELAVSIEKRETGFYVTPYQAENFEYKNLNFELLNEIQMKDDSVIFNNESKIIINYPPDKILFYNRNKKLYNIINANQFYPKNFKVTSQYFKIIEDGSLIILVLKSLSSVPELYNYYFTGLTPEGKKLWEYYFNNYHNEIVNISPKGESVLIILEELSDAKFPPSLKLIISKKGNILYKSSEWFSKGILFSKDNNYALQIRENGIFIFNIISKKIVPFKIDKFTFNNLNLASDYLKIIKENDYEYYEYNTGKLANKFSFDSDIFQNNKINLKDKYGVARLNKNPNIWVIFNIFDKQIYGKINLKELTGKENFQVEIIDKKDVIFFYLIETETTDIFIYDSKNNILKKTKIFEGMERIKFFKVYNDTMLIVTEKNTYLFDINEIIKKGKISL